ncbi:hypothetical protein GW17_00059376 [Ensete ventricosum]|nr:hypothetical protein GW17_00059376 [Ensete ventricosum]
MLKPSRVGDLFLCATTARTNVASACGRTSPVRASHLRAGSRVGDWRLCDYRRCDRRLCSLCPRGCRYAAVLLPRHDLLLTSGRDARLLPTRGCRYAATLLLPLSLCCTAIIDN